LGAGPYGLAVAAHLRAAGVNVNIFGDPMSFWSGHMPAGMLLRSPRVASSISDPRGDHDLDGFASATGAPVGSPVPLDRFVEYGHWFQSALVPDIDRRHVEQVLRSDGQFHLALSGGEQVTADRVVVAAGIAAFAHVPRAFRELPDTVVSHSSWHRDLGRFAGQRVLVVGGGQSALESAALLRERGAQVEVVTRAPGVHWLGQHPWLRSLGPLSALMYAPPEVGPPLLSQLVRAPGWVRRLPPASRNALDVRSIRPAGAGWLKPRVDGVVALHGGRAVTRVRVRGDRAVVTFDDGPEQTVDHVLLGTGYRVDLARYPFLSADLLAGVRQVNGYPVLGRGFESSVPGLHFVGATGAWTFGPLMRFVAGTAFAAAEVTRLLTAGRQRSASRGVVRT
jgi:NADPH-dependent 2,4-dienoyl-CoA reductase/sulfur reductase-like enzyme